MVLDNKTRTNFLPLFPSSVSNLTIGHQDDFLPQTDPDPNYKGTDGRTTRGVTEKRTVDGQEFSLKDRKTTKTPAVPKEG